MSSERVAKDRDITDVLAHRPIGFLAVTPLERNENTIHFLQRLGYATRNDSVHDADPVNLIAQVLKDFGDALIAGDPVQRGVKLVIET